MYCYWFSTHNGIHFINQKEEITMPDQGKFVSIPPIIKKTRTYYMKHVIKLMYKEKQILLPKIIWERFKELFPDKLDEEILHIYIHIMNLDEYDLEHGHFFPNATDALLEIMKEKL